MGFVNGRFLSAPFSGVQRHAYELSSRMPEHTVLTFGGDSPKSSRRLRWTQCGHGLFRKLPWGSVVWEQVALPMACAGEVLWSPCNSGPLSYANQVVTIHDAATLDHPEFFRRSFALWYQWLMPQLVKRARYVITVSEFSRSRLLHYFPEAQAKLEVVGNGVGPQFKPRHSERELNLLECCGVRRPYLLSVGASGSLKNSVLIHDTWDALRAKHSDLQLIEVGTRRKVASGAWLEARPGVVRLGGVSDHTLAVLYSHAVCLLYPSVYEGFGLPVVEAAACGCPTVAFRTASIPDVLGGGGLMAAPYVREEFFRHVNTLIEDRDLRRELSFRALANVGRFNWDIAASRMSAILARC